MSAEPSQVQQDWQRVSAWAMLPLLLKSAWEMVGVIVAGTYLSTQDQHSAYLPYVVVGLALLVLSRALIDWRCSRFRVTSQGIELEKGLFHKELLRLPQARVQELQIRQPFYFRPLQLYAASIDSAGSQKQEFALTGLSENQLSLLQGQRVAPPATASTPFYRIWLATLYNAYLWLPLLALFGISQQFSDAAFIRQGWQSSQAWLQQYDIAHNLLLQLLSGLIFLLAATLVLALMTLIWLYPQHLLRDARQLQLTQGTLLKKTLKIASQRVQLVIVNQPWLARLLGHYSLIFHGFVSNKRQSKFALLGQTSLELDAQLAAQQLLPLAVVQGDHLQSFMPPYFRRLAGLKILAWLLLSALLWQSNLPPWWLKVLLPLALGAWLSLDHWLDQRWHGYRVHQQVLYLWQGGVSRRWLMLPLQQVQQVKLQQSAYFQQHQMVKVTFQTANGHLTLAAIPNAQAQQLYSQVLALQYGTTAAAIHHS